MNISAKRVNTGKFINNIFRDVINDFNKKNSKKIPNTYYQNVVNSSPTSIFILDINGIIRYCNPAAYEEMGLTESDFIGKNFSEVISGYGINISNWNQMFESIVNGEKSQTFDCACKYEDGTIGFANIQASLLDEKNVHAGIIVYKTRIDEPAQVEKALRDSEQRYRTIFEQAIDSIAFIDIESGEIKEFNDNAHNNLGYTREEFANLTIHDIDPDLKTPDRMALKDINQLKSTMQTFEAKHRTKSGQLRDVRVSTSFIRLDGKLTGICIWHDITNDKAAEAKQGIILKTALDGFSLFDINGRFLEVNDSYCQMLGYTREEMLELSIADIEAEENVEETSRHIKQIIEHGFDRFETKQKHKDGRAIEVEVSVNYLDIDGGQLFTFVHDITERKKAEQRLRESEGKYRAIFEQASDSIVIIDSETDMLVDFNTKAHENLGYSRKEFAKLKMKDVDATESHEAARERLTDIDRGKTDFFESKHRTKGGDIRDVLVSSRFLNIGTKSLVITIWHDITERRRMEEALRESEEKYRDIIDNTSEIVQSVMPDGHFRYVNKGWRETLGYKEEEISRLTLFDIIHPDYMEHCRDVFQRIMSGEKLSWVEGAFINKTGKKIYIEGNVTCKFLDGKPLYTRGIFRDITHKKNIEEQMVRLSSAVSMSTDCIVLTDSDAKISDVNQKTLELYGAESKDELVGKHFLEIIKPTERAKVNMDVKEIMGKGYIGSRVYNIVSKDALEIPMQINTSLVKDADGNPMGMVRVGRKLD